MPIVTADEIRPLRRDAALELALTRACREPQSLRTVHGRLLIAAAAAVTELGGPAFGLAGHDLVGDRADGVAGALEVLVPAVQAAAGHHAQWWTQVRGELGLGRDLRDKALSRFGAAVGRAAILRAPISLDREYRAAAAAARHDSGPSAAAKRAVGIDFPDREDLRFLYDQAGLFVQQSQRFHWLLNRWVGAGSRDWPRCRCAGRPVSSGPLCRRDEVVAEAAARFLDKVQRQLASHHLSGHRWPGNDPEGWFWNLADWAVRDALKEEADAGLGSAGIGAEGSGRDATGWVRHTVRSTRSAEVRYHPADEVFRDFQAQAAALAGRAPAEVRRWLGGPGLAELLEEWDHAPHARSESSARRDIRTRFLHDTARSALGPAAHLAAAEAAAQAVLDAVRPISRDEHGDL